VGVVEWEGSWTDEQGPVLATGSVQVPDGADVSLEIASYTGKEPEGGGSWSLIPGQEPVDLGFVTRLTQPPDRVAEFQAQPLLERRTLDRYAQLWRLQVEPTFGHVPASRITTGDVRAWVADLLAAGLSRASVAQAVTVLSCCLKVAVEQGIRRDNPTRGCRPRPDIPEQGNGYTPDQVRSLVTAAEASDAPMYLLAATTGLRFGELTGLRVIDVDRDSATLAVRRVVIETKGHQIIKAYPKGGSAARRFIALPPGVIAAITPLVAGREPDQPLWPNRVGGPQYYSTASAALRRARSVRRASIPPGSTRFGEPLRHSACRPE
jgi:integrase